MAEVEGITGVTVKCADISKNTNGESTLLDQNWHSETKARGANRIRYPSSPSCKRWKLNIAFLKCSIVANALSFPPGEYARKSETQRNWRGPAQAVEHVVSARVVRRRVKSCNERNPYC